MTEPVENMALQPNVVGYRAFLVKSLMKIAGRFYSAKYGFNTTDYCFGMVDYSERLANMTEMELLYYYNHPQDIDVECD